MDSLINLDSPIVRNKLKSNYDTNSPLIPGPSDSLTHETPNNPFDEVIRTVELNQRPDDPFDIVLEEALRSKKDRRNKTEIRSTENESKKDSVRNKTEIRSTENESKKDSMSESCSDEKDDEDLTNKIRELVSERIVKCIKKTLNSSTSQTDLTQNKKSSGKYFQRSHSASYLRLGFLDRFEDSGCSNCGHKLNISLPLENSCTSDSYSHKVLNTSGNFMVGKTDDPKESSVVDLELTKDRLRKESEKMRRLLSLELLPKNSGVCDTNNSSEDLLDVMPPWDSRDIDLSDEEDSIGLPKLKKFRCSLNAMPIAVNQNAIDERVLNKYLKRRSSTDFSQPDDSPKINDSIQTVDTFSPDQIAASSSLLEDEIVEKVDKIELEAPKLKDIIEDKKIEMHPIKDESNPDSLRPKKNAVNKLLKKGPMKAVLPLQKMSKNLSAKMSSPFKNKTSATTKKNIAKDEKQTENIHPVAASTPTKSSPDSDVSISSLRGRENNKMSPTGRKAAKRSQSTGKVEISKNSEEPINSFALPSGSGEGTEVKNVSKAQSKIAVRPHSAPDASGKTVYPSSQRAALKVLARSSIQKSMRSSELKNSLRAVQPVKSTTKDKENQSKLKKK